MATPDAAPTPTARPRWFHWTFLAAAGATLVLRAPDRVTNPQFWAEDGLFYLEARTLGAHALVHPMAGYLQLVPRLIALVAQAFDPAAAPLVFTAFATALTLYVVGLALSSRCPLPFRPALGLAVILSPHATEILLRNGNAQWVLAAGFLLLALYPDPTTPAQRWHDLTAITVLSFSGPFCIALAPLFLLRALRQRSRIRAILAALVVTAAVIQLLTLRSHQAPPPPGATLDWGALAAFPGIRLGATLLGPVGWAHEVSRSAAVIWTIVTFGGVAALALLPGEHRRERALLGGAFALLLGSAMYRCWWAYPEFCGPPNGERYFYLPGITLLWLLLTAAGEPRRGPRVVASAALAVVAFNLVLAFRMEPLPDLRWREHAQALREGRSATIPINPTPTWQIAFPAQRR